MTVPALLRVAAVFDFGVVGGEGRTLVQRGALQQMRDRLPVVVDHDPGRVIGFVRELFIAPDVVGGVVQDWYFASCDLTDPPGWLKRGGGVSFRYAPLVSQDVDGATRLLRALIDEVSVLSPVVKPADPSARVAWIGEQLVATRGAGALTSGADPPAWRGKKLRRTSGRVIRVT